MSSSERPAHPDPATPSQAANRAGSTPDAHGRRAALITGAGKRLGRAIALEMAAQGWDIIVHYHRSRAEADETAAQIAALGRQAISVQADLTTEARVDGLFEAAAALPLRAVINNASHFEHDSPASFAAASLQTHLGPNLIAPVRLTQRLHAWLPDEARGVVVNLLDQKLDALNPDFFSYTLTKSALLSATRMMAMSFAPKLRVTGVSPGLTLPSYLQTPEAFAHTHRQAALLDSSSTAADIVNAVLFMVNSPAITGVNLTVDGGQHMLGLRRDVSYLQDSQS